MLDCPVCGDRYAYHYEHHYVCPTGHVWRPWETR